MLVWMIVHPDRFNRLDFMRFSDSLIRFAGLEFDFPANDQSIRSSPRIPASDGVYGRAWIGTHGVRYDESTTSRIPACGVRAGIGAAGRSSCAFGLRGFRRGRAWRRFLSSSALRNSRG